MTNSQPRLSIFAVWEDALSVLRAEWSLVLPVAFSCFGLPLVATMLVIPTPTLADTGPTVAPGPWMLMLPVLGILFMIGSMAIAGLALRGGVSVHEALERALRRLPAGIGLYLVNIGVQVVVSVFLTPLLLIGSPGGGQPGPYGNAAVYVAFAVLTWVYLRVMPVWTLLYRDRQNPLASIVAAWHLTRGHTLRLLALRVLLLLTVLVLGTVIILPTGAITRLIGTLLGQPGPTGAITRLIGTLLGQPGLARVLAIVICGALMSTIAGVWTVYVAVLTRRLEALSSGT